MLRFSKTFDFIPWSRLIKSPYKVLQWRGNVQLFLALIYPGAKGFGPPKMATLGCAAFLQKFCGVKNMSSTEKNKPGPVQLAVAAPTLTTLILSSSGVLLRGS